MEVIIVTVVIGALIFAAGREFFCWYFKINERVALLKQIANGVSNIRRDVHTLIKESNGISFKSIVTLTVQDRKVVENTLRDLLKDDLIYFELDSDNVKQYKIK